MTSNEIQPKVVSVNVSREKGTPKTPVDQVTVDDRGIVGDAHAGPWARQVSLLAIERINQFAAEIDREIRCGEFAENITTRGIDLLTVALLDRFKINAVELEVVQIGKECHGKKCAIFQAVGKCIMPQEGIFCRVLRGGTIKPGDTISYFSRPLRALVVTLSDRASRGDYEDQSGPQIQDLLEKSFQNRPWHLKTERIILPDDEQLLKNTLEKARMDGVDMIFTTGGTGIGPRDITPEVVMSFAPRIIPGIMESIRAKFAPQNPNALLSRSLAGIIDSTLIYTLPGSPRAVREYMGEILLTLEHLLLMTHGLDVHEHKSDETGLPHRKIS